MLTSSIMRTYCKRERTLATGTSHSLSCLQVGHWVSFHASVVACSNACAPLLRCAAIHNRVVLRRCWRRRMCRLSLGLFMLYRRAEGLRRWYVWRVCAGKGIARLRCLSTSKNYIGHHSPVRIAPSHLYAHGKACHRQCWLLTPRTR